MEIKAKIPKWIKKALRNRKAREKYFLKRYGSLERMYEKDARWQQQIDDDNSNEELALMEQRKPNNF